MMVVVVEMAILDNAFLCVIKCWHIGMRSRMAFFGERLDADPPLSPSLYQPITGSKEGS